MKRKFYTSYVYDGWTGEKIFDNARVLIDVPENGEKIVPILLQEKLSAKINCQIHKTNGRFFPVTLINFWEIDLV
jgi:hypothetical protein